MMASGLTFSTGPIFFEFTSELVYPVPESVVGGFLSGVYNLVGMIFLLLFYIPVFRKCLSFVSDSRGHVNSIPATYSTWIMMSVVFAVVIPIPLVLLVKEEYNRSVVDQFQEPRSVESIS